MTTILEESMEEDAFSFWFPHDWGRHLIVGSNGPDKDVRSAAVQCISATGKYRKAIGYFQSVTDFANFRRGPGLLAHRSIACRRFAAHDEFAEVFGEELNSIWAEHVADSNIQDPEVAVESMQMWMSNLLIQFWQSEEIQSLTHVPMYFCSRMFRKVQTIPYPMI